jgi:hypothetical protein
MVAPGPHTALETAARISFDGPSYVRVTVTATPPAVYRVPVTSFVMSVRTV